MRTTLLGLLAFALLYSTFSDGSIISLTLPLPPRPHPPTTLPAPTLTPTATATATVPTVPGPTIGPPAPVPPPLQKLSHDSPLIYYHGRWDANPGTWWAGSGLKLSIRGLRTLSLELGPNGTWPHAAVAVSLDYGDFFTVNATANGVTDIPLLGLKGDTEESLDLAARRAKTVRINVLGWQNNRIHLQGVLINADAQVLPYRPSKRAFQFIGDSLSAGQFLDLGVNQAWPFLVAEHFKAEHRINAQPGATLTDMESYGNVHGVSYQFFQTEDTGFVWSGDHNFTTSWDFAKDKPAATHVVIHIGANDSSHGVSGADFVKVYSEFLAKLRKIYARNVPIFIFTPFGWPSAEGATYYYYEGQYEAVVNNRHSLGDRNVHLVNTTGWQTWDDVFPDNVHPNVEGHAKVSKLFSEWLEDFERRV